MGFEPMLRSTRTTPLAGEPLRPLGYFSKCGRPSILAQERVIVKSKANNIFQAIPKCDIESAAERVYNISDRNNNGVIVTVKEQKTNAMRILEQKKIKYTAHEYPHGKEAVDGVTVAQLTGQDPSCVFKTLVTRGASKANYVFVIPVAKELELKKAAKAVGEKSVAMIHVSEITALTGYVRGGCSPVGMKKLFKTVFDSSALEQNTILVSGGKIGSQIECSPADLAAVTRGIFADVTD